MAAEYLERMGARMRDRRLELHLSRSDVARRMPGKTNENAVYRWETGLHRPQPDTLEALAKALEVDVSYFMTASNDKTSTPSPFPDASAPDWARRLERRLDALLEHYGITIDDEEQEALAEEFEEVFDDTAGASPNEAPAAPRSGREGRRGATGS